MPPSPLSFLSHHPDRVFDPSRDHQQPGFLRDDERPALGSRHLYRFFPGRIAFPSEAASSNGSPKPPYLWDRPPFFFAFYYYLDMRINLSKAFEAGAVSTGRLSRKRSGSATLRPVSETSLPRPQHLFALMGILSFDVMLLSSRIRAITLRSRIDRLLEKPSGNEGTSPVPSEKIGGADPPSHHGHFLRRRRLHCPGGNARRAEVGRIPQQVLCALDTCGQQSGRKDKFPSPAIPSSSFSASSTNSSIPTARSIQPMPSWTNSTASGAIWPPSPSPRI